MNRRRRLSPARILLAAIIIPTLVGGYLVFQWWSGGNGQRRTQVWAFFRDPASQADSIIMTGERCGDAPFLLPTDGLIGFLWGTLSALDILTKASIYLAARHLE